jgi:hypothetical protein
LSSDLGRWWEEAACFGEWKLFDSTKSDDRKIASSICADCPVRWECLQDSLNRQDRHGFHGGVDELEIRIMQAVNSKGETHVYPGRRIRCGYCGPRSTKHLVVLERRRTKTHLQCSQCGLEWWTRKLINRRADNF